MTAVEHYRRCIEACICPICGAGPFKSMPMHASRVHGLDRHEMRRRAEIPVSGSITSPELAAASAERAKEREAVTALSGYVEEIRGKSIKREIPDYSRRNISENLSSYNRSMTPEERSQRSKSQSRESRQKQAAALAEWHKRNPATPEKKAELAAALMSPKAVAARERTAQKRRQPCGTRAAYKRGCRCAPCRSAKSKYAKEQYQAKTTKEKP